MLFRSYNLITNYIIEQNLSEEATIMPSGFSLGMNELATNPAANKYSTVNTRFPGGFEVQITMISNYTVLMRLNMVKTIPPKNHVLARVGELMARNASN